MALKFMDANILKRPFVLLSAEANLIKMVLTARGIYSPYSYKLIFAVQSLGKIYGL